MVEKQTDTDDKIWWLIVRKRKNCRKTIAEKSRKKGVKENFQGFFKIDDMTSFWQLSWTKQR